MIDLNEMFINNFLLNYDVMKSNMISGHVLVFLRKARKKNMTGKQLARLMNDPATTNFTI